MKMLGICSVFCMLIIYVVDVCDAECGEYVVVFEELSCLNGRIYRIMPQKRNINWDNVTIPCNSEEKDPRKEVCHVEFNCVGTELHCRDHIRPSNIQSHHFIPDNKTAHPITIKPEAPEVTTSKIEKPHLTLDEEFNAEMYDLNIIYINENDIRNSTATTSEAPQNETVNCDYAQTICVGEMEPKNDSLSELRNVTYNTHHDNSSGTLLIKIDRDKTSPVQPIFTGYFPNDNSKDYSGNFKYLKTITVLCPISKHSHCIERTEVNIYLKTNYIQNNTVTKYPNCTKESITYENVVNVNCEQNLFAKNNQHIIQPLPISPPKHKTWTCQIKELNTKTYHFDEMNKLYLTNCSNDTHIRNDKIKSREDIVRPITESKNITTIPSSFSNLENMATILLSENTDNCSHIVPLNIGEGKIIDLGINIKEIFLHNKSVELKLSNCINHHLSIIDSKQPPSKAELIIILKSESLNTSNLEKLNGTSKDGIKQRILLRCDHTYNDSSSNSSTYKSTLRCESLDLDFYNITGIETVPLIQKSKDESGIKPENKTMQGEFLWICQILELDDTSKGDQKTKIYFKDCFDYDKINNSKNRAENKNVDDFKSNEKETPSEKLGLNKDLRLEAKNTINIRITENPNNCSNSSLRTIYDGKIIDLGEYKNKKNILQNNIIELNLSTCLDINTSIMNESHPDSKMELTILLKNESLNSSNLEQFNGTLNGESDKHRILLRCDHSYLDTKSKVAHNTTVLNCETVDLVSSKITGIEINTNRSQASNKNINKEQKKEKLNMVNTTIVPDESKELPKNITEKKIAENKDISQRKEISKNLVFNRRKDIPSGKEQNSLALGRNENESIFLIVLLAIVSVGIIMAIIWRIWPKKREYNPAPTREPPDEEETMF